jgi:hypothetical protein
VQIEIGILPLARFGFPSVLGGVGLAFNHI